MNEPNILFDQFRKYVRVLQRLNYMSTINRKEYDKNIALSGYFDNNYKYITEFYHPNNTNMTPEFLDSLHNRELMKYSLEFAQLNDNDPKLLQDYKSSVKDEESFQSFIKQYIDDDSKKEILIHHPVFSLY